MYLDGSGLIWGFSGFGGLRFLVSFYFTTFNMLLPAHSLRQLLSEVGLLRKQTLRQICSQVFYWGVNPDGGGSDGGKTGQRAELSCDAQLNRGLSQSRRSSGAGVAFIVVSVKARN